MEPTSTVPHHLGGDTVGWMDDLQVLEAEETCRKHAGSCWQQIQKVEVHGSSTGACLRSNGTEKQHVAVDTRRGESVVDWMLGCCCRWPMSPSISFCGILCRMFARWDIARRLVMPPGVRHHGRVGCWMRDPHRPHCCAQQRDSAAHSHRCSVRWLHPSPHHVVLLLPVNSDGLAIQCVCEVAMVQPVREDGRGQPFALSLLRGLASLLSHGREFACFFQHGTDLACHTHMRESMLCSHSATLPAHDDAHALDEVSRRVHPIVGRAMGMVSMTEQANTSRHAQPPNVVDLGAICFPAQPAASPPHWLRKKPKQGPNQSPSCLKPRPDD